MVAAFPVAKLGALLIKQISKPLANVVKTRAKTSPFFRNYICMPPAQFYHWCEVRMRMWSMNMGKPVNVPKMNEANAIELGAELVGETVIFTIAAVILMAEYVRSTRKETAKEDERRQEMQRIQADLKELYFAKAKLETEVRELIRILHIDVNAHSTFNPDTPNIESIPVHHRNNTKEESAGGFFSSITNVVWDAMELVFPTEEPKEELKNSNVSASKTPSSPSSPAPNSSPSASANSVSGASAPTTSSSSKSQDSASTTGSNARAASITESATTPKR